MGFRQRFSSGLIKSKLKFLLLFLSASLVCAEPMGLWVFYQGKHPRSVQEVWLNSVNDLNARVKKIFYKEGEKPIQVCATCPSPFHNAPIIGLHFLRKAKQVSERHWQSGQFLDLYSGNIFSVDAWLSEDGQTLTLNVYLFFSFLGTKVIWKKLNPKS